MNVIADNIIVDKINYLLSVDKIKIFISVILVTARTKTRN